MYQEMEPIFIRNITPMHVGVGSDLGIVDLPIQREKHTGYPKIESSSIKGCVREYFESQITSEDDWVDVHKMFGYDDKSLSYYCIQGKRKAVTEEKRKMFDGTKGQFAGAVGFTDARILFFPVKSAKGVYAYVTCLGVLKKFLETMEICNFSTKYDFSLINGLDELSQGEVYCCDEITLDNKVILEEYVYEKKQADVKIIFNNFIELLGVDKRKANNMVIVHDDEFADFVSMYTEVITRTKISNKTGTVEDGALFTEEYLPSETIMYTLLLLTSSFYQEEKNQESYLHVNDIKEKINKKFFNNEIVLQIGSGATIGKGIVKLRKEN